MRGIAPEAVIEKARTVLKTRESLSALKYDRRGGSLPLP
jgi:hypothetical protein